MSNHIMTLDVFGVGVRAETDGYYVSLNDMFAAGNKARVIAGKPVYQMAPFLAAKATEDYIEAASIEWGIPAEDMVRKIGENKKFTRTMVHLSVALLAAEALSPKLHALMHKELIVGKLLEGRLLGATEFKRLNTAIDSLLPGREEKSNKHLFILTAKLLRAKVLGGADKDWDTASAAQTNRRYEVESMLCEVLRLGLVRDWEHFKAIIQNI